MTKADTAFIQELNSLVAKEAGRYKLEPARETDWTIARAMEEHGLSEAQARKLLERLTRQGRFEKVKVANPNGGPTRMAYRPVEKKP